MNHSAFWYFERFGLLEGLSDEQEREIEQHARMLQMKRGQPIYLPGDPSDSVYVVKTGAVKIVGKSPEGCEVILGLLTPGDLFGELALTGDDEPQEHRAEAMDDTILCQVPRDLLMRMIQDIGSPKMRAVSSVLVHAMNKVKVQAAAAHLLPLRHLSN